MAQATGTTQTKFNGGISKDPRQKPLYRQPLDFFTMSKHFDIFSNPSRLIPYRNMVTAVGVTAQTYYINFVTNAGYGSPGSGTSVFGLGVQAGQAIGGKPELYVTSDYGLGNGTWSTALASAGVASLTRGTAGTNQLFIFFKNYCYFAVIGKFSRVGDLTASGSSATWTESWQSVSWTNVAQGLVFSTFGGSTLFIPYDNKIATYDGTTWTASAFTVPDNLIISSISTFGNYIAVACRPSISGGDVHSRVFLWDGSSPAADANLDWGFNDLYIVGDIEGTLFGISKNSDTPGISSPQPKFIIKSYTGGEPSVEREINGDTGTSVTLYNMKVINNNKFFFCGKITIGGVVHHGSWIIGRTDGNSNWAVTYAHLLNNDTALTGNIDGFDSVGDIFFASINDDGTLMRTNDQVAYTNCTSILETQIFDEGSMSKDLKLNGVATGFEPLPSGGAVKMRFKADSDSSFTDIFTDSTQNDVRYEAVDQESNSNAALPDQYNEIKFRLESTGGAVIIGYKYAGVDETSLVN